MERIAEKIGLVGGGQMGEALVRGMLKSGLVGGEQLMVAEPDRQRQEVLQENYGLKVTASPGDLAAFARVVVLAVKPQVMSPVLSGYQEYLHGNHLVISIAAGIPIAFIEQALGGGKRVIRVMPNTPALVLAGASALSANALVDEEDRKVAEAIFSAVGSCVWLDESLLDAVTGLSGSGPGYVFAFIEAMIDGGVLAGLPRPVARQLVVQTVLGSARLALETGEDPAVLRGRVTSPGGTTIEGLRVLEEAGLRGAVMNCVAAASNRSRELGG